MFIQLKNKAHIDATKIQSISSAGVLTMMSGEVIDLDPVEFPWLVRICGFLVETKDKTIINIKSISSVTPKDQGCTVTFDNGTTCELTEEEGAGLAGLCQCLSLQGQIDKNILGNVQCHDYKKL